MGDRGVILVVSDDARAAGDLRDLLGVDAYDVVHAPGDLERSTEALAAAPDLIVVDVGLERADPFELAADLHHAGRARDLPVVFLVAESDVELRVRGLQVGDDLISTPLDPHEALARVQRQVTISRSRAALRESEAKFRSVMESAIDAIISTDADGVIRSWNSAAADLFGHAEEEAVGRTLDLIIPERFRERHRTAIERVSHGGPTNLIGRTVEFAGLRSDGTEFPIELALSTWFLDADRYYTGIIRDISDRVRAEERFRSVTDSAVDAIISADHTGRIVSWNPAATRILGHSEADALGRSLELVIPARYREQHRAGMARYAATGEAHVIGTTVELEALTASGAEIPVELSLSTWTVGGDRYYTGIIRDLAERRAAEAALRRSEEEFRAKEAEFRARNAALEETIQRINSMQDQLLLQEKMASIGRLSAGMAHEMNNPASAAQRGAAQASEVFARLQEAQIELGRLGLYGSRLDKLRELDALAARRARDPVELGAVERSDREAEVEDWLERYDVRSGGDLAASIVNLGVTRDGLDELGMVFGDERLPVVVEWLGLKSAIYALLSEIVVGTNRIVELVRALKMYTYMDQTPVQDVDVRTGLDDTLVILHNKLKHGVRVVREFDADLPLIQAYASELNQVWTNLIDNAIDAMGGQGTLTLRARRAGDRVEVQVEDDGPGVPADIRSKLFDLFFTTKAPGEGTGLGLAISRNIIVKKHGGEFDLESRDGCTRFTVRLPIGVAPDGETGAPAGALQQEEG
ncbi:Sensor protein FixL [Agromyces sp. NDB4Y10]|uniref:hybrid sensor histidine kinase/response regulator n=1 Tax=Agromyces sp. NDB4Y10 TaxID=1775951 RepID=UPI0007B273D8|nr:PAS domain S-box protein [Agromyces sp. NDB4Y10]KZE92152.1 Sensor protein FixL [Agromyces sp. NDB4Y10]